MNIGQLAKATGASARAIRHYEAEGLLRPERSPNGYRIYTKDDAAAVKRIRWLISAGLSTRTIREILPCAVEQKPKVAICSTTRSILKREADRIDVQIKALKRSRKILKDAMGPENNT